jgi:hypothetical protein
VGVIAALRAYGGDGDGGGGGGGGGVGGSERARALRWEVGGCARVCAPVCLAGGGGCHDPRRPTRRPSVGEQSSCRATLSA